MNRILFFYHKYLHSPVFFPTAGQRLNSLCHVYSFELCQTHLQHTKALWATQLPAMGHGAPGTLELMNYHLFHVKCHCRFMPLKQDELSIFAAPVPPDFFTVPS